MKTPLLFLLLLMAISCLADSNCPNEKKVGGVCFSKVKDAKTKSYGCTQDCIYENQGKQKFCFKEGSFDVVAEDTCTALHVPPATNGTDCNRNCLSPDPKISDPRTCKFDFALEQLWSNETGRLVDGVKRPVLVFNGVLPGPTIVVCEGDNVMITLKNRLQGDDETLLGGSFNATTLHFHGIREKQPLTSDSSPDFSRGGAWSDGVPLVTQCPVPALTDFQYFFFGSGSINSEYNSAPAGSYWYHSHVGSQRINGAEGKLIIMPKHAKHPLKMVDKYENSLLLQEWYNDTNLDLPCTLLVNGKSKQNPYCYKQSEKDTDDFETFRHKFKMGYPVDFDKFPNPNYPQSIVTNYEIFNITDDTFGETYRFRIISGIGEDTPIRVSVEDHKFSVISADSIDVEPVSIDAVWVAAGERYDIAIQTKQHPRSSPYKINIFHEYKHKKDSILQLCSLAWLKYPGQTVNESYEADCEAMKKEKIDIVLNPVPNVFADFNKPGNIYPFNLNATAQARNIDKNLNTHYVSMDQLNFNNFSMPYPYGYSEVPYLYQSPANNKDRCGTTCDFIKGRWPTEPATNCTDYPINNKASTKCPVKNKIILGDGPLDGESRCKCQHIIKQPWWDWALRASGIQLWFEIVLINRRDEFGTAHPIHKHGGWYNVIGMGQWDQKERNISRDAIMAMDQDCKEKEYCLPRKLDYPVFKDVIQVPTNGYIIFRAPIDNRGVWITHCHINYHIEHGMAMAIQIGESEPGDPFRWALGSEQTWRENKNRNCSEQGCLSYGIDYAPGGPCDLKYVQNIQSPRACAEACKPNSVPGAVAWSWSIPAGNTDHPDPLQCNCKNCTTPVVMVNYAIAGTADCEPPKEPDFVYGKVYCDLTDPKCIVRTFDSVTTPTSCAEMCKAVNEAIGWSWGNNQPKTQPPGSTSNEGPGTPNLYQSKCLCQNQHKPMTNNFFVSGGITRGSG